MTRYRIDNADLLVQRQFKKSYSKKFKRISPGSGPLSPILLLDKLFINSSEFIHKPI